MGSRAGEEEQGETLESLEDWTRRQPHADGLRAVLGRQSWQYHVRSEGSRG